jgi:hypothetical protein
MKFSYAANDAVAVKSPAKTKERNRTAEDQQHKGAPHVVKITTRFYFFPISQTVFPDPAIK